MILIMLSYLMLIFIVFLMFMTMYMMIDMKMIVLEWLILKIGGMKFSFLIYIDFMSLMFLMVVSLISFIVMIYSIEYMEGDKFLNRFSILMILFILSMFLMVLSPSMLTILLGWDGLGLISFCLVIYYQNSNAYSSGMLTVFCNRIGDVGILMVICLSSVFGSWNMMLYYFDKNMIFLMMMIAFTKSAQIPFSLWLPAAMMAPTPISSLVHSSTLVTAGVYLLIRYNKFLFIYELNEYLFLISSMTMFMSGLIANFEYDFKKIVALSTLSQLALMMSVLSIGLWELAYFHLIIHALFKSLMFLCVGSFIHYFNNDQDIRNYGGVLFIYPYKIMIMCLSLLCLMGFPFLSGYYSKDFIMESFLVSKINIVSMMFLFLATMMTVSYSIRLIMFIIFSNKNYSVILYKMESPLMNYCMMMLAMLIISSGYLYLELINWSSINILTSFQKFIVLKLLIYGLGLGYYFFKKMYKYNYFGYYFSKMFCMASFYKFYYLPLKTMKLYEDLFEKNIIEICMLMLKYKLKFLTYKINKYNLGFMLISNIMLMFMMIKLW